MKKSVVVVCITLIALTVFAWFSQVSNVITVEAGVKKNVKLAESLIEDGLYQKAISAYEEALLLKDNQKIRKDWVDTGKKAYEDGVIEDSDFIKMLEEVCNIYPQNVDFREELLSFCFKTENYKKGFEAYKDCKRDKISNEKIHELGIKLTYIFNVGGKSYTEYTRNGNGYYTAFDGDEWGVIDPTGERIIDNDYIYISPYNLNCDAVYVNEKGARVINEDSVVEHILKEQVSKSGAFGNGYLPVCNENNKWRFLNCETGEYEFDEYEKASNFIDGIATVCKDGKWSLINTKNEKVTDETFDDVKLQSNGDYAFDGVMIASKDGKYGIYDAKGKALCDFFSADMDAYYGGNIAFCDELGKWGFVDKKGTVVVDAKYEKAKSFSNGLAAVCEDNKWGYIDKNNDLAIEYQFLAADYFSKNGVSIVSSTEGQYYVLKLKFFGK